MRRGAYDVIVVGLGAMGSSAAYQLARRGQRVLGLEAFEAGHTLGSSHGESRIIRLAYFEHPSYVPLLRRAYALWETVQAEVGRELLRLTGGLFIGQPHSPLVEGSLLSARTHGLEHAVLSGDEMRARFPALRPAEGEMGVFEAQAGVLFPERCIEALLGLAAADGAELHHAEAVRAWQAHADRDEVEVWTDQARYTAGRLVLTVGAWASKLLGLPLKVERIPVVWFEPRQPVELPIYIWDTQPSVFYGVPHLDWPGAKVGRHHQGQVVDPDRVDRAASEADEAPIRAFVESRIPGLAGPTVKRLICLYTDTPDEHFLIDRLGDGVVFAAGFSGHGFKFASVVGEILADLVLTGHATPDAEFLRLARLSSPSAR